MTTKKVDFHKLGDELWQIANIFRDDTLKTTEYLEEFSYFLFLKLFDDKERMKEEANKMDGLPFVSTLPEELRFYNWANKIVKGEISISEAVPYVRDAFQKYVNLKSYDKRDLNKELSALSKHLAEIRLKEILDNRGLFKRIFDKHIWRIKYGPTIRDLLKRLIDLKLEQNFDVMGRAYEFVVQKLGEQKQYGQYFTPRHIIHFMVELANPEIGEKIYDPAAGTGGFILRAFEVVRKRINDKYKNDYSLAEKYFRELKEKSLWGVEKAPDVYKLALMNMILHNDGKSNLYEADSLDNRAQIEHKQKYDVVLTNPPYGPLTQSRVGVFDYHVKRFEALFIQHVMNALKFSSPDKKPSRAVVIILDKILFDSTRAFKNIRIKLLREFNLKAVISMPAGIFQPYSGVKTTILYFEKPTKEEWNETKSKNDYTTKHILFFDVKSDGFTLSTQRRPINGAFQGDSPNIYEPPCGDLPKAVEVFKEWLKALDDGKVDEFKEKYVDNEQIWIADIEEVKEKDFNLNPGLYRKVERGKIKWEWVEIKDIASEIKIKGDFDVLPYIEIGDVELDTKNYIYKDKTSVKGCKKAFKDNIIISNVRPTRGAISYIKEESIEVSNGFTVLKIDPEKALPKFIFYILAYNSEFLSYLGENSSGSSYPTINSSYILNYKIPLPPLEIQQQIVERIDKQQAIIEKVKEMEKAILDAGIDDTIFKGDWEWVELGKVIREKQIGLLRRNRELKDEGIPYIKMDNIEEGGMLNLNKISYTQANNDEIKKYSLKKGDILFNVRNSRELVGKSAIYRGELELALFNHMILVLRSDELKLLPEFLNYSLLSPMVHRQIESIKKGSTSIWAIYESDLFSIKIPLPPLEKQKEIIEFLDVQFEALEKIRKLRKNAEKMIKIILEKEVFVNE